MNESPANATAATTAQQPTVRVVGHRGAATHAPENTMASFERAMRDGAEILECDVHLSADGHVIVMHDETIDRTADPDSPLITGALADLSLEQIKQVRVGGGETVPTLDELLEATTVPLFVEVKAPAAARAVAQMLGGLPADHPASASTVISFHPEALEVIRIEAPSIPCSLLVETLDEGAVEKAVQIGAVGIGPWIGALSLHGTELAHEKGLSVNPWTVNDARQLAVARACGVDTITTDDPAWVREDLAS